MCRVASRPWQPTARAKMCHTGRAPSPWTRGPVDACEESAPDTFQAADRPRPAAAGARGAVVSKSLHAPAVCCSGWFGVRRSPPVVPVEDAADRVPVGGQPEPGNRPTQFVGDVPGHIGRPPQALLREPGELTLDILDGPLVKLLRLV